ncbi:transcriptional regulator [Nostoc sp. 'Peltigera membranacea cyanobiont' 213]|uniref:ABC transporter substrate-binding protein n=1 Tax=unclassified Nostoc TaxID=2593658 RepID=UPI000B95133D|nr:MULTISPECIES: ABC transporter substrate-binding protein [unclassified Nostoc]AVH62241.1 ribose ABC transporter substrate-binding protein RbsB [Nostoc sp. 'Peltigera membranacea cyanobiont' N6]OYD98308.1 transcriptional regulator [Nostoc sp. 'Peltigera membranacea cyanobiont' 213]
MKRILLIVGILGFTVVSCTNSTPNDNSATNTGTNTATNTSLETKENSPNRKLQTIGVALGDLGNPFYNAVQKGAEIEAKRIGDNIRVNAVSSGFDLNQQSNQIENFTAANTDLIILSAVDKKGVKPVIERARLAGKVVIAVDSAVDADVDAMISSNNTQAGEVACQYIADRIKGQGSVVILNGTPMDSINQRVSGCEKSLAKYPNIKLISKDQNAEGTRDGGLRVMSDLLTTFPKIDAVFATNDQSGVGADLAARQAKRKEFFIVGVDGSPDATKAMEDKDGVFAATAAQNPAGMAEKAVQIGNDIIQGKKPESPDILIPVNLVTRDNLSSYKGW